MLNALRRLFTNEGTDYAGKFGSVGGPDGGIARHLDFAVIAAQGDVRVKVVGVGGAGGNAVARMASAGLRGVEFLAVNTDVQALRRVKGVPTYAIGPIATGGMGSGGSPDRGRKAVRENLEHIGELLEGSDMVFVTAGMGGGTGTGAAPIIAEIARRKGALTVGVVTRPFSFEGQGRMAVADKGLKQLGQKVDTLITVENDRLLTSLDGEMSLERGFRIADEVLRQGVEGISEIITVPGTINVDFADVKSVMMNRGVSFMALGEGKGRTASTDAVKAALANPLFTTPIEGAQGILFNVRGGRDLSIGQVQEIAGMIEGASKSQAQVVFGVVQDPRWNKRVRVTLVATGIPPREAGVKGVANGTVAELDGLRAENGTQEPFDTQPSYGANGHQTPAFPNMRKVA
ncbi:MAG: cell division protein FtsZ [Dehalococcoidia bacterium]|nr:cell division protein FtsZ [Dehalococcoidia bacterium]